MNAWRQFAEENMTIIILTRLLAHALYTALKQKWDSTTCWQSNNTKATAFEIKLDKKRYNLLH